MKAAESIKTAERTTINVWKEGSLSRWKFRSDNFSGLVRQPVPSGRAPSGRSLPSGQGAAVVQGKKRLKSPLRARICNSAGGGSVREFSWVCDPTSSQHLYRHAGAGVSFWRTPWEWEGKRRPGSSGSNMPSVPGHEPAGDSLISLTLRHDNCHGPHW